MSAVRTPECGEEALQPGGAACGSHSGSTLMMHFSRYTRAFWMIVVLNLNTSERIVCVILWSYVLEKHHVWPAGEKQVFLGWKQAHLEELCDALCQVLVSLDVQLQLVETRRQRWRPSTLITPAGQTVTDQWLSWGRAEGTKMWPSLLSQFSHSRKYHRRCFCGTEMCVLTVFLEKW